VSGQKRAEDLEVGDLTAHAGGGCGCSSQRTPFRVEHVDRWDNPDPKPGENKAVIEVTWKCTACGEVYEPLPCGPDLLVDFFGTAVTP
jgi:hypothetical protein